MNASLNHIKDLYQNRLNSNPIIKIKAKWMLVVFTIFSSLSISAQESGKFKFPDIPESITSKNEKIEYVLLNYWDAFNYDSLTISEAEQVFVDYITILNQADTNIYNDAFFALCMNIKENAELMDFILDCSEKYLYEKGAPLRNHKLLYSLLQSASNNTDLNSNQKELVKKMADNSNKNTVNSTAPDFNYIAADSINRSLYNNISELNLIFFFDPLCQSCLVMGEEISKSAIINDAVKNLNLSVFYITPFTDETERLNTYFPELPESWKLGYNPGEKIVREKLYFWEYIPSIYLIDGDKKIILKDALPENIEAYFNSKALNNF